MYNPRIIDISISFSAVLLLLKVVICVVFLLVAVAYFTLEERKLLATIQRRKGPNVHGVFGLLQPLADGCKLFFKECVMPSNANAGIFLFAPQLTLALGLAGWSVIPFSKYSFIASFNIGLLYVLAASSLGVYGIIASGWSSNSKYPMLGALRSAAQIISYEIAAGFIILTIGMTVQSFEITEIIWSQKFGWFIFPFHHVALVFFIVGLAETNRHPFDLPEAEAELVSGYNVEYSGMPFALFSLGEYLNMLMISALMVILFFGGWLPPFAFLSFIPGGIWFSLKLSVFVYLYVLARAALPRYRYDQLMSLGWSYFVPGTFLYFIFCSSLFKALGII